MKFSQNFNYSHWVGGSRGDGGGGGGTWRFDLVKLKSITLIHEQSWTDSKCCQSTEIMYLIFCMSLITRKPVFGLCNQVRLKPAFSATEAS